MTLFALSLLDLGLSETLLHIVRIIASVGGAVVGWFVCDPLTRLVYRLSFRGATPASVLLSAKGAGAAGLSLLIYFFLPLGGGGGLGFGPGAGGTPGMGPGNGGNQAAVGSDAKNPKDNKGNKLSVTPTPNQKIVPVEIEILGGGRVQDQRYYLIKGSSPMSYDELKTYFEKNRGKISVTPVLTEDSFGLELARNPLIRLKNLADEYGIEKHEPKSLLPDS